jgi:hypothetical protein
MYAALPLDKESITKIKEAAPKERVRLVNEAIVSGWADEWMKLLEQKFEDEYGYNPTDVVRMPGFSPAKAAAQLREQRKSLRLTENTTLSQVWALTTHMVATMALDAYQVVPTVYKEIAQIEQSDSAEETYFPLQQTDTPQLVGENEPAPESRIAGVLTRIVNYRFARIIPISRKAIESDKTGRLKTRATGIGGRMGYAEERWWAVQLFAAYTSTYIRSNGGVIPGMCVAGQSATEPGYGGPTTFAGDVTLANLENLFEAAPYVTDLTGNASGLHGNCDDIPPSERAAHPEISYWIQG